MGTGSHLQRPRWPSSTNGDNPWETNTFENMELKPNPASLEGKSSVTMTTQHSKARQKLVVPLGYDEGDTNILNNDVYFIIGQIIFIFGFNKRSLNL